MRTHLQFRNPTLVDQHLENDQSAGLALARWIGCGLTDHGIVVNRPVQEDWGWLVKIENAPSTLWIGCGHHLDHRDGHLCFIEPSRPWVRRWFKRIDMRDTIARIAQALEATIRSHPASTDIRWWPEDETL